MSLSNYVRKTAEGIKAFTWDGTLIGIRPVVRRLECRVMVEYGRTTEDLDEEGVGLGTYTDGGIVAVWLYPTHYNKIRVTLDANVIVLKNGKLTTMSEADFTSLYDPQA